MNDLTNATPEQIDEVYDKLIEFGNSLTEEQIEKIKDTASEVDLSEDTSLMRSIESGEVSIDIENDTETVTEEKLVNIDPVTGKAMSVLDEEDIPPATEFDEFLKEEFGDVEDVEVSDESIIKTINKIYGSGFSAADIMNIIQLVKKYQNGEDVKYKDMPASIKSKIAQAIISEKSSIYAGNIEIKDQMARSFIENIAMESFSVEITKIHTDLNESIDKYIKDEMGSVVSKSTISQRDILERKVLEIADKIEDEKPEDAAKLRNVSKQFTESYTYESMKKMFMETGKLKIKKFELEKPNKVYQAFNFKYAKTKMVIRDISMVEPILDRNLPDNISLDDIRKFLIVFCKYCKNFNPDNIVEHTFMYYFITNICTLDVHKKSNTEDRSANDFYNDLINNIVDFINIINSKESSK